MIITDDFLDKKDLDQLDEYLMSPAFPWYLQKEICRLYQNST